MKSRKIGNSWYVNVPEELRDKEVEVIEVGTTPYSNDQITAKTLDNLSYLVREHMSRLDKIDVRLSKIEKLDISVKDYYGNPHTLGYMFNQILNYIELQRKKPK